MRITQNYMTRSYMKNLNRNLSGLASSNQRMSSMRRFDKVWEDVSGAARAYKVRDQMQDNENSLARVQDSRNELAAAEGNMMAMSDIMKNAQERMLQGMTGTITPEQRVIIAGELENLQKEVLQLVNAKFGDRFLFSGSGSSKAPFDFGEDGELTFNGVKVDSNNDISKFLENDKVYLDVGLGIQFSGGKVKGSSAFQISTSGLDVLGFGTSGNTNGFRLIGVDSPNFGHSAGNAPNKATLDPPAPFVAGSTVKLEYTDANGMNKTFSKKLSNPVSPNDFKGNAIEKYFDVDIATGTFTSKDKGTLGATMTGVTIDGNLQNLTLKKGSDSQTTINLVPNGGGIPTAGQSVSIDGKRYEFVANAGDAITPGSTAVVLGADANASAQNLMQALTANGVTAEMAVEGNRLVIQNPKDINAGTDLPNNLISLLGDAAKALRSGDISGIKAIHGHVLERNKELLIAITDVGNRDSFLEHTASRLEKEAVELKTIQKNIEATSIEEESIYNKTYELAWTATLQLGSKVIPPSIFDFMR